MIQMHTSLLHHLVKTINTKMKIIREQVQLIQFLLKIIFSFQSSRAASIKGTITGTTNRS